LIEQRFLGPATSSCRVAATPGLLEDPPSHMSAAAELRRQRQPPPRIMPGHPFFQLVAKNSLPARSWGRLCPKTGAKPHGCPGAFCALILMAPDTVGGCRATPRIACGELDSYPDVCQWFSPLSVRRIVIDRSCRLPVYESIPPLPGAILCTLATPRKTWDEREFSSRSLSHVHAWSPILQQHPTPTSRR